MSFQKIRNVIAVGALAAGVSWFIAGPSAAAEPCGERSCKEKVELQLNDGGTGSSRMISEESNQLAMAAGELARHLGLTGLATGKEALGLADMGGIAATWGMPSLASASPALFPVAPGPLDMADLSTMAVVPRLPLLPEVPRTPLQSRIPSEMSVGQPPFSNSIAGHGIESPLDVQEPVNQVGAQVIGELLPKAVEGVQSGTMLPGGGDSGLTGVTGLTGLTGLLPGLG